MEMQKVPDAGYEIVGLPVSGLVRSGSIRNISVAFRLFRSMIRAGQIIKSLILMSLQEWVDMHQDRS